MLISLTNATDQSAWETNARSTDLSFDFFSWNLKDLLPRSEKEASGPSLKSQMNSVHSLAPYFFTLLSRIHANAYVSQVTSCCQDFRLNFVCISHIFHGRRTCRFHSSHPPYFDTSKISDDEYKLRSSSLWNVSIRSSVTSCLLSAKSLSNPLSGTCLFLTVEYTRIISIHNADSNIPS